jgi:uncharacterized protein (DUF983 family)
MRYSSATGGQDQVSRYGIAPQQGLFCGVVCRPGDVVTAGDRKDLNMNPVPWQPDRSVASDSWPHPKMTTAIGRGLLGRCPACGKSYLFNGFLRVVAECSNCRAPLGLARADDVPPYITILITGHVVVPLLFMVDRMGEPPVWLMSAIFLPLTFFLAVGLLQPVKGGVVGIMLTLNMLKSDPAAT